MSPSLFIPVSETLCSLLTSLALGISSSINGRVRLGEGFLLLVLFWVFWGCFGGCFFWGVVVFSFLPNALNLSNLNSSWSAV